MQRNEVINLRDYYASNGSEPELSDCELPTGTRLLHGQYTLTGFLNSGGFGITYRAEDSLARDVVIKECFPTDLCVRTGKTLSVRSSGYLKEFDSVFAQFMAEAYSLASLDHDNIVRVHQIFEENDTAYIAIDFIDGPDLLALVEDAPDRLSPDDIENLARKTMKAVQHVHSHGMLHRDLAPDNILVRADLEPILIDFGAAHVVSNEGDTSVEPLKAVKDGYSPLEFYDPNLPQGTWSDVYSFAASFYQVITGEAPVDAEARSATIAAGKPDPYNPLEGTRDGFSPEFLRSLDASLAVKPADRIQTAEEWLDRSMSSADHVVPEHAPIEQSTQVQDPSRALTFGASIRMWLGEKERGLHLAIATATTVGAAIGYFGLQQVFSTADIAPAVADAAPIAPIVPHAEIADPKGPETHDAPVPVAVAGLLSVPGTDRAAFTVPEPLSDIETPTAIVPVAYSPEVYGEFSNRTAVTTIESSSAFGREPQAVDRSPKVVRLPLLGSPEGAGQIATRLGIGSTAPSRVLVSIPEHAAFSRVAEEPAPVDSSVQPIARGIEVAALLARSPDAMVDVDTTPAAPLLALGGPSPEAAQIATVAPSAIRFSHWDVVMPFNATLERVRKANTAVITDITDGADLSVSGQWIREGTVIYTFNGEALATGTPLSGHVLNAMNIDADGFTRASVRYRDPVSERIDRGLLAVPVVRRIGLADETTLEARNVDLAWTVSVLDVGTGSGNTLQAGDILLRETGTATEIASHEDLNTAFNELAKLSQSVAEFDVIRNGKKERATLPLSIEN